jgi:hypothetical protein
MCGSPQRKARPDGEVPGREESEYRKCPLLKQSRHSAIAAARASFRENGSGFTAIPIKIPLLQRKQLGGSQVGLREGLSTGTTFSLGGGDTLHSRRGPKRCIRIAGGA